MYIPAQLFAAGLPRINARGITDDWEWRQAVLRGGFNERNDILIGRLTDGVKGNVTPEKTYPIGEHGWRLREPKSGLGQSLLDDQSG